MQGGAAIVTATVYAPAMCHRASASSSDAAAIATVQAPAMCHRAIATVQAPAMCQRAIAIVRASAMWHCQKLSTAGVHTSGVPPASFLFSY